MSTDSFNQQQNQLTLNVSDPKFIGYSLLKKFNDIKNELDLLSLTHSILSRDVTGTFEDNKYQELSRKLSILEVNNNFPDINSMKMTYTKDELLSMLSNLNWTKNYFLNTSKKVYVVTDTSTNPSYLYHEYLIISQNGSATLIEKQIFDYYFTIPVEVYEEPNPIYLEDVSNGNIYQLTAFEGNIQLIPVNISQSIVNSVNVYDPSDGLVSTYSLVSDNGSVQLNKIKNLPQDNQEYVISIEGDSSENSIDTKIEEIDENLLKYVPESFLQDFVEMILGDQTKTSFDIPEYVKTDIFRTMYSQKLEQLKSSFGSDFEKVDLFLDLDAFIKENQINEKLNSLIDIEQQLLFSGLVYVPIENFSVSGTPIGEHYSSLFYVDKNNNINFKAFTDYKTENIITRCLTYLNDTGKKVISENNLYSVPFSYDGVNPIIT